MSEIRTAERLYEEIARAFPAEKMNGYARAYLEALRDAVLRYPTQVDKALKVQVLYIMTNIRARGPEQKAKKKELLKWAKSR